jgi:hypothetical protein
MNKLLTPDKILTYMAGERKEGALSKINKASMGADIAGIAHGVGYGTEAIHPWILGWSVASLGAGILIDKWINKNKQGQESTFSDKLGTVGWFGVGGMIASGIFRNGPVFQIAALTTAVGLGGKWLLERGKNDQRSFASKQSFSTDAASEVFVYSEAPSKIIPFTRAQSLKNEGKMAA